VYKLLKEIVVGLLQIVLLVYNMIPNKPFFGRFFYKNDSSHSSDNQKQKIIIWTSVHLMQIKIIEYR